jgi:hypothetical protein
VQPVLKFPPQPITVPLALEASDVAIVGLDFVPYSFVHDPVKRGTALAGREGDYGFSKLPIGAAVTPETRTRPQVAIMNAVHDLPVLVARDKGF